MFRNFYKALITPGVTEGHREKQCLLLDDGQQVGHP
jgi:hypothetical protein